MAREKKLIIGAVNITIQPHTPERYLELMKAVYRLRKPANISGDQFGLLAGMHKLARDQEEPGPITGDIFRYTDINRNAQWFNTDTNDFADDDDVEGINIPENLKPNSSRFSYIFFPDQHLIFYEGYYDGNSFGPANAERFFTRLLNADEIAEDFGRVEVTHVPERNTLESAIRLRQKEKIMMMVKRPNPDDHAETERRVMERMRARNVEKFEQSYKAVSGQSIEMDDELETMAHISARNGSFYLKGKDENNRPVEYSTKEHPMTVTHYYDPDSESAFALLERVCLDLKDRLIEWIRR